MKKIILSIGILSIGLLFAKTYEVTNISCDEHLSVRIKPSVESFAFTEINCDKKGIELIKCQKSDKKYHWCKVRYKLYENIITGWVYNKYLKETPTQTKPVTKTEVEKLLKSAKAYYYGTKQVGQNYEKALKLFLKASKKDSVMAYRYLGTIYLFGHGTDIDKEESKKWLMKAIDLDDENAKKIYAKYFLHL